MFPWCVRHFSIILRAVNRESSRVTEMHRILRKYTGLHVSRYVFLCIQGSPLDDPEVRPWPWSYLYSSKVTTRQVIGPRVKGSWGTWYAYGLFTWGQKYSFFHISYRLHSLSSFVWGTASQGQMSFFYRVCASGPACLALKKQFSAWSSNGPLESGFEETCSTLVTAFCCPFRFAFLCLPNAFLSWKNH